MSKKSNSNFQAKLKNILKNVWENIKKVSQMIWKHTKNISKKAFHGFMSAKTFWSAFAILIILLIISIVVLSIRLHDYTKTDDRAISLRSSMDESLNVFAMEYKNDSGEITVKGHDGTKVIAPGTDVEYTLRLRNTDKVALDYSFVPELDYTSEHKLPIVIRLLAPNDEYIIGNETTWVPIHEVETIEYSGLLMENETAEYVFQWKWPFESENDEYDTFLGTATLDGNVGVDFSFGLHAEANTTVKANGGFFHSPSGKVTVLFIIFLLLAAAIALLLIHIIKRMKAKKNEQPIIVEVPVIQTIEIPVEVKAEIPTPTIVSESKKPTFSGKMVFVNIDTMEKLFHSGDRISIGILKAKGVIPKNAKQMKILARSAATLDKAFIVETQGISKNAEAAICRAGGRVIIAEPDTGDKKH